MNVPIEVKIGQMIMVGFRGTAVQPNDPIMAAIRDQQIGGIWLCDLVTPQGERVGNIASADQLSDLIATLKRAAPNPLLVAIDAEGGRVIRLKPEYGFPPTQSAETLGAMDDPDATASAAAAIATTLKRMGVHLNLAPVIDLNRAPENPSLGGKGRCFSSDPDAVIRHAKAFIHQHHAAGGLCAIKHFPGQGSAQDDAHDDIADVTETWSGDELTPFTELCRNGLADAVLVGHVIHRKLDPERPATLSQPIIHDLLRGELGFDGVVICDDLGMGAIHRHYAFEDAIAGAVDAGVDILLHANTGLYYPDMAQRVFAALRRLVDIGRISAARIDASYARIRRLKARIADLENARGLL